MEPTEADALHAELVAAFFHPPRIVVCAYECSIDDDVLVVTHVELWPWRTVVRASVTRPGSISFNDGPNGPPGDVTIASTWLHDWSLRDDVGTEYSLSSGGMGGDGFCKDIDIRFRTAVPADATQLTIVAPTGRHIDVVLR